MQHEDPLKKISWTDYQQLSVSDRAPYCLRNNKPYHALFAQQYDRPIMERVCELATRIRKIAKTRGGMRFLQDLLAEKRAMLYFSQPSTRTFLSFSAACQILGIRTAEVRDTSTSSEIKGESQEDSVRTFSSYFDLLIMRHPKGGFAERIAWLLSNSHRPVPVLNAGSGADQHPTQALLDIYTLQRSFEKRGGIDGKQIAFVGDLARGRTVRSLACLLAHYQDVKLYFIAPDALQIGSDILTALDEANMDYEVTGDFRKIIPVADAIYMTRIQDEWDQNHESRSLDTSAYHFTVNDLPRFKADGIIMHPLPRREEIDAAVDRDPRAMYWRQVRNGMWVRVALMLFIFEKEKDVDRYYADLTR